jgi:HlyD family secretion protein
MKRNSMNPKVLFFLFVALVLGSCSADNTENQYLVKEGEFVASMVETGELEAVKNNVIVVPGINWRYANNLKIIALVEHGTKVKKGDVICEMDKSSLMKTLFDNKSKLEVEETNLDKMLIQQSTSTEQINTEIKAQEATFSLAKLQLEKFKFETEKRQQIKKLEFEKATIDLQKAKDRQKANSITNKKAIYIQKIKILQIRNLIKDIERNMPYFSLKAPVDGMIEIKVNEETNQMLKIGDRVWTGEPVASVPDMSQMKVKAKINETDISKIKTGQMAEIKLQAFPNRGFGGKVTRVFPICYSPDKDSPVKVFDFDVLLDKADEILKPGMSVSCEVFYAKLKDKLFIENDCIIRSDTAIYVITEKDKKYHKVVLGPSNNEFVVISGDIKKGDKLIPVSELQNSLKSK